MVFFSQSIAAFPVFANVPAWVWLVWVFVLGACVGSFLNVVIYRLPAGKSLVRPGSHCPKCGKPIRARHNVPILGWLLLRGKCRDCQASISVRYPLIEFATGAIFVAVALVMFGWNGIQMPDSIQSQAAKYSAENAWRWQAALASYYIVLACFLLAAGMIGFDEKRQHPGLTGFAAFVGLVAPLFAPWMRPTHFLSSIEQLDVFQAIWDGLFGIVTGITIGYVVAFARQGRRSFRSDVMSVLAVIGAFLGWQAVLTISAAASVTELGRRWAAKGKISHNPAPWICWAAVYTGVHLFAWRWVAVYSQDHSESTQGVISVIMLAVIAICNWGYEKFTTPVDDDDGSRGNDPASRRRAAAKGSSKKRNR